jgi:hypothetical protein
MGKNWLMKMRIGVFILCMLPNMCAQMALEKYQEQKWEEYWFESIRLTSLDGQF